jgi:hypothetical protein
MCTAVESINGSNQKITFPQEMFDWNPCALGKLVFLSQFFFSFFIRQFLLENLKQHILLEIQIGL